MSDTPTCLSIGCGQPPAAQGCYCRQHADERDRDMAALRSREEARARLADTFAELVRRRRWHITTAEFEKIHADCLRGLADYERRLT